MVLGVLLRQSGYRVTSVKIDPYLNVDAGTMSPFEHGEARRSTYATHFLDTS